VDFLGRDIHRAAAAFDPRLGNRPAAFQIPQLFLDQP